VVVPTQNVVPLINTSSGAVIRLPLNAAIRRGRRRR
jgi:hypothetical protein